MEKKFYNAATTDKLAEAIGMPAREDLFLSEYLTIRNEGYEEYLHYLLVLGKTYVDELPTAAHRVCIELRKQLMNTREEAASLYNELESIWKGDEKLDFSAVAETSAALAMAAEKAESLRARIISICKDFPSEGWAQLVIKSIE